MNLKKYNVIVRRFDPTDAAAKGEEFILPVDSSGEEHAISAAMSNAVAFTTKVRLGVILDVAFRCVGIEERS